MRALVAAALSVAIAGAWVVLSRTNAGASAQWSERSIPLYGYTLVKTYPHDRDAFTQGLQYLDGVLYEGTGLRGRSSIRRVDLETGKVLQRHDIPAQYFGEGITVWKAELFQLTWQSGVAFVYDRETFAPRRTFRYTGEGWGLTHDGTGLIMSDGTDALRFLDPATFAERRRVTVTAAGQPVRDLNELEFVKGEILANVWQTDTIARIEPKTGRVTGWIDLTGLLTPRERATTDVLNGIAYDAAGDRLFVTGKLWPKLFEIRIVPGAGRVSARAARTTS
jgi:glutamine cyclotransferase